MLVENVVCLHCGVHMCLRMYVVCKFDRTAQEGISEPVRSALQCHLPVKVTRVWGFLPSLLCHLLFPRSLRDRALDHGSLTLIRSLPNKIDVVHFLCLIKMGVTRADSLCHLDPYPHSPPHLRLQVVSIRATKAQNPLGRPPQQMATCKGEAGSAVAHRSPCYI